MRSKDRTASRKRKMTCSVIINSTAWIIINNSNGHEASPSLENVPFLHLRTLQQFKAKSVAAKKGFELLKKKADALKAEFRKILGQILAVKK